MAFIVRWPQYVYTLIYNRLPHKFSMGLYHYYSILTHLFCFLVYISLCFESLNKAPLLQRKPESAGISRDSCGYQDNITFFHLFFLIEFLYHVFFLNPVSQFMYIFTLITNLFSHSKLTATCICKFIDPFIFLS